MTSLLVLVVLLWLLCAGGVLIWLLWELLRQEMRADRTAPVFTPHLAPFRETGLSSPCVPLSRFNAEDAQVLRAILNRISHAEREDTHG